MLDQASSTVTGDSFQLLVHQQHDQQHDNYLWRFSNFYRPIHGWLSSCVCLFGILSNTLNIIVLTRPNMISSPTNLILTCLAASDLLTMLSTLPSNFYSSVLYANSPNDLVPERDTLIWAHFSKIHVMTSVTFHSISIWLTVYLAVFRYFYLVSLPVSVNAMSSSSSSQATDHVIKRRMSTSANTTCLKGCFQQCLAKFRTYTSTICSIITICIFCVIFCFPAYIYPTVRSQRMPNQSTNDSTAYVFFVDRSDLDIATDGFVFRTMNYSHSILGKFVPCLLLVTFSSLLIQSLIVINKNNKKLKKRICLRSEGTLTALTTTTMSNTNALGGGRSKTPPPSLLSSASHKSQLIVDIDEINRVSTLFVTGNGSHINHNRHQQHQQQQQQETSHHDESSSLVNNATITSNKNTNNNNKNKPSVFELTSNIDGEEDVVESSAKPQQQQQQRHQPSSLFKTMQTATFVKLTMLKKKKKAAAAANAADAPSGNNNKAKRSKNRVNDNVRTTLMLTTVCILFLITEFPQALLTFFNIVLGNNFYENVYMPLGDLVDMITLFNTSISFLLYCTMSRQFRDTFYEIIKRLWVFRDRGNRSTTHKNAVNGTSANGTNGNNHHNNNNDKTQRSKLLSKN